MSVDGRQVLGALSLPGAFTVMSRQFPTGLRLYALLLALDKLDIF